MPETLRDRRIRYAKSLYTPHRSTLVRSVGDLDGSDVLVLGRWVSETLCELTMTECRSAESRTLLCRGDRQSADIVLVPNATEDVIRPAVVQAVAHLRSGGQLAMQLPAAATYLSIEARSALTRAGFNDIVEKVIGGDRVIVARWLTDLTSWLG